jgi:hypothetical protein
VKKAKSKRAATILYNRIIKSDDYYEVGMRAIKEEKLTSEQKLREAIRKIVAEDFAGSYPTHMRKKFDQKRRKQSEVFGFKLTGKDDIKTEIDDATVHEKAKPIKEGFADKFMKSVDKHNQKIVDNALALAKQQAPKDIDKSSKKTPKLIAIKTINRMKELRNKTKSPALKQTFQKTIDKLEKDYKKIKEGKITEAKESTLDIAKRIVKNHQHEQGVDVQTAKLIVGLFDAYKKYPNLQKKLEKLPLKKLAQGVWRFVK